MADIRAELQAIAARHGDALTPELLVEEARPKGHPLHSRIFDRPPKEAAEAWYRDRAHQLLREFKVTYVTPSGALSQVRAWHAVRAETGTVYRSAEDIATDPFLSELVIRDMEREFRQLWSRYERFQEFRQMVARSLAEAS